MTAPRLLLGLAAVAIGFAAADTYVVVLALPDMMTASGLNLDELQRAAPIVSGFLLGYVGILPLIGRIADLRGRVPVLIGCLVVFAAGSVVTAAAYDLTSIVVGRFFQGLGGGGLIPPTLALVADRWPPERRGLPLGVVGAVQELGSVLGPLYGALVLAFGTWRDIFWLNCAVGLVIAAALWPQRGAARRSRDLTGLLLVLLASATALLVMLQPRGLVTDITIGLAFVPFSGESRWWSPLGVATGVLLLGFAVRQATARDPLVDWTGWRRALGRTDPWGALALSVALGAVIVTFASAEPESGAVSSHAPWLLLIAALAGGAVVWRQRRAAEPIVPRGALRDRVAAGSLVVSFFVGASLIAALVDIPFFARLTVAPESQLDAALVLVRFLVALPIGAVVGGWLTRRVSAAALTATAMLLSAAMFAVMSRWEADALTHLASDVVLVAAGFGFGLAIAPVNAALLDHTAEDVHGVASALLVVARMVGMLVGVSALSAIGLRAFQSAADAMAPVEELCGDTSLCPAYNDALREAGIAQLQAVFTGAMVCALAAAFLAVLLLRKRSATVRA
ncbi:MFS transporter [Aeromicrobium phragmitis]|uniref:MFS transporter n=1 Tax=Aeromicrobium phragmitis TaxID=2478914 RepID=A0A3L8PKC8_9ACTN|nr:MFS transporter [Aeromicrobium phragmitis]RLV55239.1 MFS transporter [Aeromicrobium phragmitis]